MLRYNKSIQISTDNIGRHTIKTDKGQLYRTAYVSNPMARTQWWDKQHKSELRELQKDIFLGEFSRLYNRLNWHNQMDYYLVYEDNRGYAQPHDIVFARIPNANIWLLGSLEKSWVQESKYETFDIDIDSAVLGEIANHEHRKLYYKDVLAPIEKFILARDEEEPR